MSHYDYAPQPQALQDWQRMLHWNASSHGWIAETYDFSLFVPEDVYERAMQAYFTSLSIERKTYLEIMHPAEEAWQRQCALEQAFRANLEQWLSSSEPRIQILRKK